jgi:hypothetical protein
MPETIDPGYNMASDWHCSNSSAKLSVMGIPGWEWTATPASSM